MVGCFFSQEGAWLRFVYTVPAALPTTGVCTYRSQTKSDLPEPIR